MIVSRKFDGYGHIPFSYLKDTKATCPHKTTRREREILKRLLLEIVKDGRFVCLSKTHFNGQIFMLIWLMLPYVFLCSHMHLYHSFLLASLVSQIWESIISICLHPNYWMTCRTIVGKVTLLWLVSQRCNSIHHSKFEFKMRHYISNI